MNQVAPVYPGRRRASLFTASRRGPASYEQRRASIDTGSPEVVAPASPPASYEQPRANIGQRTADPNCRWPWVSNLAHSIPGAGAVRWQPPHSCGGGALQRSEKASPLRMRFSAGHFGASPSSRSIRGLSNPINCFPAAASNPAQSNRRLQPPQKPSGKNMNLSRVEMTPILCFVRLTDVSIRPHVSVRNPRIAVVFAPPRSLLALHDASQNNQSTLRKETPTETRPIVGAPLVYPELRRAAPAPRTARQSECHDLCVNQPHG
jgi:hypothetical protein